MCVQTPPLSVVLNRHMEATVTESTAARKTRILWRYVIVVNKNIAHGKVWMKSVRYCDHTANLYKYIKNQKEISQTAADPSIGISDIGPVFTRFWINT